MRKSEDKKPLANPAAILREEFDDWAILFDQEINDGYGLNPVSVLIWKCLDGKHSIKDIAGVVRQRCKNVPPEAEEHIQSFISELVKKGLAGYQA